MKNNLTPVEKRIAIARTWDSRINKLANKSRGAKTEAEFCRTHKIDAGFFNRNKNLRVVPTQKTVDLFEQALKKERI